MKFCPVCQTRYDEEIMRFCTKDGTPLIDEETPNFAAMPSENVEPDEDDDISQKTIIRRKPPEAEITNVEPRTGEKAPRMVIPTSEPPLAEQQVRAKPIAYQQPSPPKKANTAVVVLLTFLGTIVLLGGGLGIYRLMSGKSAPIANSNSNLNADQDANLNTNLNVDNTLFNINTNINANSNVNTNSNANANLSSPSPSPSPSRSPSPSPSRTPSPSPSRDDDSDDDDSNTNSPVNTRPTPGVSPRTTPSTVPPGNSPVNVGNMNSRAVSLSKPAYPQSARLLRAGGQVPVRITVDETGRVTSAKATGGHPLLRQSAENAARNSRFDPVRVSGQTVRSVGTIVYNFVEN